jgi:hypothetical protein
MTISRGAANASSIENASHTESFRLCVRTWDKQDERLLFDPEKDAMLGTHNVLLSFTPSWKGDLVRISVASGGSESAAIHVLDVPSGKQHSDTNTRDRFYHIAWLPMIAAFCTTGCRR